MLPAEAPAGPVDSGDEGDAPAPQARRFRCERCLEVVSTRHPWDVMACRCGELVVSGVPRDPTVRWSSGPGGGWSEVDEDQAEELVVAHDAPPVPHLGYLR